MSRTISVVLERLELLAPEARGMPVHGANLATSAFLCRLAADDRIGALELFLPAPALLDRASLERAAHSALPPDRRGHGILRFHALHSLPDAWADNAPRTLFCLDPEWLPAARYLRDRFAGGPTPVICDTHGLGQHQVWPALARLAAAPRVAYDTIVCLSETCKETYRTAFDGFLAPSGSPAPCRLDVLPRAVDAGFFACTDATRRAEARRLLGLPIAGQIALYLGRVTPHDKADLLPLLGAFAAATERVDDFLAIVGDENSPGYARRLRETGDSLGLGDRLILRPGVSGAARPLWYAAADLFVFPGDSVQETFGNTVIEAMACGLPVVVSDWDGLRELVTDGETGLRVPTYWLGRTRRLEALSPITPMLDDYLYVGQTVCVDSRRLAAALSALLEAPERRQRMGAAARQVVETRYTWPVVLDRWHALWDELDRAAAAETADAAACRRRHACALGLPTPYERIFAHAATRVLDAERQAARLSAAGRAVAEGRVPLLLYDDVLPLVQRPVVDRLFATLSGTGVWTSVHSLLCGVGAATGFRDEDVLYHLALLVKRDLVELSWPD